MKNTLSTIRSIRDFKLFANQLEKNLKQFDVELNHSQLLHVVSNTLFNVDYHNVKKHYDKFPVKKQKEIFSHSLCYSDNRYIKKTIKELHGISSSNFFKMIEKNETLSNQFVVWLSFLLKIGQDDNPYFENKRGKAYIRGSIRNKCVTIDIGEFDGVHTKPCNFIRRGNHKISHDILDLMSVIMGSESIKIITCRQVSNKYLQELFDGYGFASERSYNNSIDYEFYKAREE